MDEFVQLNLDRTCGLGGVRGRCTSLGDEKDGGGGAGREGDENGEEAACAGMVRARDRGDLRDARMWKGCLLNTKLDEDAMRWRSRWRIRKGRFDEGLMGSAPSYTRHPGRKNNRHRALQSRGFGQAK